MFKAFCKSTRVLLSLEAGSLRPFCRTLTNSVRSLSQHESPPPSNVVSELLGSGPQDEKKPVKEKASEGSVLLFPGQGSQFVGMGRGMLKYGNVREMYSVSQKILGYDLLSMCLNGPKEDLNKTVHCQPAVFVASLAAVERLNHEAPEAIEDCRTVAGFSVGEYAALVFAGSMDFAEALYAVKVRAEAMQEASDRVPSGMLSVFGRPKANYNYACLQAREHCLSLGIEDPVCAVASYLFPDGRVIAGHQQALDFLQKNSRQLYFQHVRRLPVSGAFHTSLMQPAVEPLHQVLSQLTIRRPLVAVYGNVDGKRYAHEGQVRRLLSRQLVAPVHWEQTLHTIYERERGQDFPRTYEVGPGHQLGSMLQKVNLKAFWKYTHVDVVNPQE